jgi:tRNA A37 N6-isopentenylltransferase MiaA
MEKYLVANLYNPRFTVTVRRECDGKVEREQSISLVGGSGYYLEEIVSNAISLASLNNPQPDSASVAQEKP